MNQSQMTAMIHQQPATVIVTTKLGGKIYVKLTVKNCGYTQGRPYHKANGAAARGAETLGGASVVRN
jgi:hypothetical protein